MAHTANSTRCTSPSRPRFTLVFFRSVLPVLLLVSGAMLVLAGCMPAPASAAGTEASFERTLSVTGSALQLTVSTGSGSITLTRGSDNQVHVIGHVKGGWGSSDSQVREIADHPPIEQTGNIVRIGGGRHNWHNISISYQIEAPGGAFLKASTGSGRISDNGVGMNASLSTGSGSINATALQGGFTLKTGSGSIHAEQVGEGDVTAHTGSGGIDLKNLRGGLNASTGSGSIKLAGTPLSSWHVRTGSGSVEFWSGNAAFQLDASTGSGSVKTDRQMAMQGKINRHHVTGTIGNGGPMVKMSTGSGNIQIH